MKPLIAMLLAFSLLTGCFEEVIDLDLNEKNSKIAIEAWITDLDEPQYITMTYTANFLGNSPYVPIIDATVSITNELGLDIELINRQDGTYHLPQSWDPVLDQRYTLTIDHGGQVYSAEHIMRRSPVIEDLTIDPVYNDQDSLIGYETVFAIQDPTGKGDAYYVIDYLKGSTYGDTLLNGGYADDEFFDGQFVENIRVTDTDRPYHSGDTVVVEIYSLGKETSNFLMDVETEVFRGGPFDPPASNVRTNISGDAIGYFIMSGADQKEIVIE